MLTQRRRIPQLAVVIGMHDQSSEESPCGGFEGY